MNHLALLSGLVNRYFGLRHGRSEANQDGLVASSPALGLSRFGLTEEGRRQVREAVAASELDGSVLIYCSDFLRARETAEIAREVLAARPPATSPELRERFFGIHDGGSHSIYENVWARDRRNPAQTEDGVESVHSVLERTTRLVRSLELLHREQTVLLISHGDPLQILQCGFRRCCPSLHRTLPSLSTGAVRALSLAG
ncbi:MAG: histidine phosphatase family protein [Armatimonadetes bacterium]|nr:histidine phosphatase family protein [Armatimonadota bacterium]